MSEAKNIVTLADAMKIEPNLFGPLWGNPIFNPYKDANHCHALIKHLNGLGYEVDVLHWEEGDATVILKRHTETQSKSYHDECTIANWMHGVCELALKVLA